MRGKEARGLRQVLKTKLEPPGACQAPQDALRGTTKAPMALDTRRVAVGCGAQPHGMSSTAKLKMSHSWPRAVFVSKPSPLNLPREGHSRAGGARRQSWRRGGGGSRQATGAGEVFLPREE